MKSIFSKLENLTREYKNTSDKIIAINVINAMRKKQILTQKQLAKICFVSESKITKFIQNIGEPNYKLFISKLKSEHFLYDSINKANLKMNIIHLIEMWCRVNYEFIKNLAEEIKVTKNINIFASAQTVWIAEGLKDILVNYNKRPLVIYKNFNIFNEPEIDSEDLNIVFLYGRDIFTLNSYLKLINNKTNPSKNFLIASETNYDTKILNCNNSLKLDYFSNNKSNIYRNLALYILISELAKEIESK
ncbi:helix-turn-helix domain-containing protein [Spiroplasma cantharicola]|uniref:HTH cro/C1-type domain-containing protein n=1 Tax=Spiroplasma cantharicola TaxID=362837 RepID=A0A0M4JJ25_9MOLU|nr:helix-turn-helix transcriptional regulator [Spiroplasma cantharicola]ALD66716.1 hypothetical protein SCANT_v1c08100 [Spiroplasma cantharicola]